MEVLPELRLTRQMFFRVIHRFALQRHGDLDRVAARRNPPRAPVAAVEFLDTCSRLTNPRAHHSAAIDNPP